MQHACDDANAGEMSVRYKGGNLVILHRLVLVAVCYSNVKNTDAIHKEGKWFIALSILTSTDALVLRQLRIYYVLQFYLEEQTFRHCHQNMFGAISQ